MDSFQGTFSETNSFFKTHLMVFVKKGLKCTAVDIILELTDCF